MSNSLTIDYRLIFALMNGKVSNALQRRQNEDFLSAGLNINCDQWNVMIAITQRDICTQQDLCNATSLSKPTMSRIIKALEEMQLVEKRKARVDFRNNYIALTRKGLEVADRAQAIAVRTLKESLRGLTKMDIMTSQHSLNTVLQNLHNKKQEIDANNAFEHQRRSAEHRRAVRRMHNTKTSSLTPHTALPSQSTKAKKRQKALENRLK